MNVFHSQISNLAICKNLLPCHIDIIANRAQEKHFLAGEALFTEGEKPLGIHILVQGTVKHTRLTSQGRELVIFIAQAGQSVGESAVFQKAPHLLTALSMERTTSLFLPEELCFTLVKASPEFALHMFSLFSLRQHMLVQKLAAQSERHATKRVANFILHRYFLEEPDTQRPFYLSRDDLANLLGLARETLSRQLSLLTECGAINIEGRIIHIKNEQILKDKAKGR